MARSVAVTARRPTLAVGLLLALAAWLRPLVAEGPAFVAPRVAVQLVPRHIEVARQASLEAVGQAHTTELMLAAHQNDEKAVRALVAAGANINAQDDYGWSALRYAVRGRCMEAAQILIELGADVNLPSKSGRTPLMSAAGNGLSSMIRLLIHHGADTQLTNKGGQTAYDIAMRGGSTGCTACREMLAQGLDHDVPTIKL